MKFPCPKCRSRMEIQATPNAKIHVSCTGCDVEDLVGFSSNRDEAFLEFLTRFDRGKTAAAAEIAGELGGGRRARSAEEVERMIGGSGPDGITREILLSKKNYLAQYKVLTGPDPDMGCSIDGLGLDGPVVEYVRGLGIGALYRFQEEAIRGIMSGSSVVIEAPTASGKTEAFLIPVMQKIREGGGAPAAAGGGDGGVRAGVFAIFVYPTKALSRDQYPKIRGFAEGVGAEARIFDGDVGQAGRRGVLDSPPDILVTNFDVLHYHLWHGTALAPLLATARMLVIDEAHVYSGIFGSNVHYIIKRLKRVCRSRLQFVAASATLENAEEFCGELVGQEVRGIRGSGRRGRMDFAMLYPVLHTQRAMMIELAKKMTGQNHKTMVFSNSHRNAEILAIQARRQKVDIRVHRAGLPARHRAGVEAQFREGRLQAISCTPTLELGIDVGGVDCVISSTIPVNRLIQRIGRAARKGQNGYAFLALGGDPISQYYGNHPDDYFEDAERTYIDPGNPFVEGAHVLAMAYDRPISAGELPEHGEAIRRHVADGNLVRVKGGGGGGGRGRGGGQLIPNPSRARRVLDGHSIRGIGRSIDIILDGRRVGDRALPNALEELHPDAIYFLAGSSYRVTHMGYPRADFARIERVPRDHPHYTRPLTREWPTVRSVLERRRAYGIEIAFCDLHVRKTVHGYTVIELGGDAAQGQAVELDEPLGYDLVTKGVVLRAPRPVDTITGSPHERGEEYTEAGGYHAAEHVMIEGGNMITGGASQDMGGISLSPGGMIYIYDGAAGGSGASKALYDRFEKVIQRSRAIVGECPCQGGAGCPRCTFSYRCGNNNDYLHKRAALEVLERMGGGQRTDIADPEGHDRPLV